MLPCTIICMTLTLGLDCRSINISIKSISYNYMVYVQTQQSEKDKIRFDFVVSPQTNKQTIIKPQIKVWTKMHEAEDEMRWWKTAE